MVMFGNVSNYLLESFDACIRIGLLDIGRGVCFKLSARKFDVFIRIGLLDIGILEILQKAYEKLSRGVI